MPLFTCSLVIICIFLTEIHVCNWCILYFVYVITNAKQRLKSLAEKNELQIHQVELCVGFCIEGQPRQPLSLSRRSSQYLDYSQHRTRSALAIGLPYGDLPGQVTGIIRFTCKGQKILSRLY